MLHACSYVSMLICTTSEVLVHPRVDEPFCERMWMLSAALADGAVHDAPNGCGLDQLARS